MDSNDIYKDFLAQINKNLLKVEEMTAKVTQLYNEVSLMLLEIVTLYDPNVLIKLEELEDAGAKCEEYLAQGQEIKKRLVQFSDPFLPRTTAADYEKLLESVGFNLKKLTN
ncbi:uncharacterized protein LOC106661862 [Cimex lectularius]|uniref:Uncharacterized protein n=1 Tax=Cimex lectularius TaxID=79782 RepID=A0A8I6REM7_CIMLE|nr:uncharacterized protein LOC106661862 [Cimex lectularius]